MYPLYCENSSFLYLEYILEFLMIVCTQQAFGENVMFFCLWNLFI